MLAPSSAASAASEQASPAPSPYGDRALLAAAGWRPPTAKLTIARDYAAPAHEYASGHRGIDLDVRDDTDLVAPADGVVAFAGTVVDRGVLTIDHGDGLVSTLEPITTTLTAGSVVTRGDPVGSASTGGHAQAGTVHFGVRLDGDYINPMLMFGTVARAVLLPCCE